MFLDDAAVQMATLHGAVERGDAEAARRTAHTLKSSGAAFGARPFAGSAGSLKRSPARAGSMPRRHCWIEPTRRGAGALGAGDGAHGGRGRWALISSAGAFSWSTTTASTACS